MVHLSGVPNDTQVHKDSAGSINNIAFPSLDDDKFTASVYGSKFAAQDLPKHEMPDDEMPREIAYRMIKYVNYNINCSRGFRTD
jgi:glutamate decarboxylase